MTAGKIMTVIALLLIGLWCVASSKPFGGGSVDIPTGLMFIFVAIMILIHAAWQAWVTAP